MCRSSRPGREAEVKQLGAQLAGAKWNLDKTIVRAPADG